jgi:hypothetical protein
MKRSPSLLLLLSKALHTHSFSAAGWLSVTRAVVASAARKDEKNRMKLPPFTPTRDGWVDFKNVIRSMLFESQISTELCSHSLASF